MMLAILLGIVFGVVIFYFVEIITPNNRKVTSVKSAKYLFYFFTVLVVNDVFAHYFTNVELKAFPNIFISTAMEVFSVIPLIKLKIRS